MQPISDLTPTYVNGELVFVEKGSGNCGQRYQYG